MVSQEFVMMIVDWCVSFATDNLIPFMGSIFVFGLIARYLLYYTVKREDWFSKEFEKRVHKFIDDGDAYSGNMSFFVICKRLLEKTYYECFVLRSILKRRKPDTIMSIKDRLFLIQHGSAFLVGDTLKHLKYMKHAQGQNKVNEISKDVFERNPCFNKVLGVIPVNIVNDISALLPGLFIIGGIFGTFLGIMKSLPELGAMDITNVETTKAVMDQFLVKISFSMSTSIIGIILSVTMSILNALLSPEQVFMKVVDRYAQSLSILWNYSKTNELPANVDSFDEHRDSLEAMAELCILEEVAKQNQGFLKKFMPDEYSEQVKSNQPPEGPIEPNDKDDEDKRAA